MDEQEFEDWLWQVLNDSLDVDWTTTTGAKAIIRRLREAGVLPWVLAAVEGLE